jgi:TANK-binding kinase-like protein
VNKIQSLRVYMDLEEHKTLSNFQCLVMEQTDIAPENQVLLFKDNTLESILADGKKSTSAIPGKKQTVH